MVDDRAQLYTIEGFAAAILMVFTIFLVIGATTVYTPGDSHISNLQLEQVGHDALSAMSLPASVPGQSPLQQDIAGNNSASFNTVFMNEINNRTGYATDTLQYSASVTCQEANTSIIQTPFTQSRNMTGREHAIRVTQWVLVEQTCPLNNTPGGGPISGTPHAMLVEVLLWRE